MRTLLSLLNLGSAFALAACGFQSAQNKNSVQLKAGGSSESAQMQSLGGKARASTTAPWSESGSRRKETPESYQRAIDRALAHIKAKQDSMLTNPDFSFSVRTVIMSEAGDETIRLESRFKGRRVMGGDVVVQSKADGSLKKIEKSLQREIKLSDSGLISSEKARDVALGVFAGELHESVEPEAIIYAVGGEPKEAFEVVLKGSHGANKHPSELHVFVDARSGEVITKWDAICEGIEKEPAKLDQAVAPIGAEQTIGGDSDVRLASYLLPLDQTFRLHSNPGASKTIYLDFDGHTTTGTAWNSWNNGALGSSFYSSAYSIDGDPNRLSDVELAYIQTIWQLVVADFAAFDVNVTTQAPSSDLLIKSDSADANYGMRVVVTNYGPMSGSAGGIAYIDSFNWDSDTPCFVYNTSVVGVAEAISHEVGHTLGLSHDGTFDGTTTVSYYAGNGTETSVNSWAPIMGLGYYRNMTTWDNGVYYQSNNTGADANFGKGADDLAIITGMNGFGYAQDLEADDLQAAASLTIRNGIVGQFATIETADDVDWFRFDLQADSYVNFRFLEDVYRASVDGDGVWGGDADSHYSLVRDDNTATRVADHATNLNLDVRLYGASGLLLAECSGGLMASLSAGTYYFRVDGAGYGDPTVASSTGYTDYASIGDYLIRGTVSPDADPLVLPTITLGLSSASSVSEAGDEKLVFTFTRSVVSDDPLTVYFHKAGSAALGIDFGGMLPVYQQAVTFAPNASTAMVEIDPLADAVVEAAETVGLQMLSGFGYTVGTAEAVYGTILDSAPVVSTPVITLAVSTSSVSEDGSNNLVFTFTRSVVTASALSVTYSVAGTASNGSDYTGLLAGSTQTVTFAANAATATVVIDPTADNTVESDETVSFTLVAGTGYTLGTNTTASGTILNDDLASQSLNFTASADTLTGMASTNTFRLMSLSDALWSSTPDRITNFNISTDNIDTPSTRTKAITPKVLGAVKTLDAAGIAALLTNRSFAKNNAATFTFNSGTGMRTFLAINDGVSGFNAATDAVIEITGYTGSLSMLAVY